MSLLRRSVHAGRRASLLVILLLVLTAAITAPRDDVVAFNKSTLKYHCVTCKWAVRCTKNCVEIPRAEALRRGGVPCKVCGGYCKR